MLQEVACTLCWCIGNHGK